MGATAAGAPAIRIALPDHAIVIEPATIPAREQVSDRLQARFGEREQFAERSDAILDALDVARGYGGSTGVALFALLAYGEGDDAVSVTMTVLSVDLSSFALVPAPEGDPSAAGHAAASQEAVAAREQLAETGHVTTPDGRVIDAVKLPAGDALRVTAQREGSPTDAEPPGEPPELRIDYYVPRPDSTDAVILAFRSRFVAYEDAFANMALGLARSLEFTAP